MFLSADYKLLNKYILKYYFYQIILKKILNLVFFDTFFEKKFCNKKIYLQKNIN